MSLRTSFSAKILALTLIAVLVPMTIVGILASRSQKQSIEHNLGLILAMLTRESADKVNAWLKTRHEYLHALVHDQSIVEEFQILSEYSTDEAIMPMMQADASQTLQAMFEGYYWIREAWIADPTTGNILLSTDAAEIGTMIPQFEMMREALTASEERLTPFFVFDHVEEEAEEAEKTPQGRAVILFAEPIMEGDAIRGILVIQVPMHELENQLVGHRKYIEHGSFASFDRYVVDQNGVFLTSSLFEDDLLDSGRIQQQAFLELEVRVPATREFTAAFQQCQRIVAGETDAPTSNMAGYLDYRGVPVVGVWSPIPGTGWCMIAELDQADVLRPLRATLGFIVLFMAGIGAAAGVFAGWIGRRLVAPLKQLTTVATKLSEGDWSVEYQSERQDEIGKLGRVLMEFIDTSKTLITAAVAIGEGDFSADVNVRGEHDQLGSALQQMTMKLRAITAQAHTIAQGDYADEITVLSEKDELGKALQQMTVSLRENARHTHEQNWLKDGVNQLSKELAGEPSLRSVCQKAVSFTARYATAGSGTLYLYDAEQERLNMYGTFAFHERDRLSSQYRLGEGIVGQVALERSPILLKNIQRKERSITTGVASEAPLNTYTLPLIYNDELYGVLELASFERFDPQKIDFLTQADQIIATALFSTLQREKVQNLLNIAQESQKQAEEAAWEADVAKEEAQHKAEEVQKANTLLEEQQQKLRQQGEELQQVNTNLQEQQFRLQQQSEELRQQNESLALAREELNQRAEDLELASKYKSEFLANMSHELRTPLNSIILLSKMLSRNDKGNLDEKDVKQAKVIHQAGEELLRLINDILDLSKIEAGKVTVNVMEFTIESFLDTFRDLFHTVAEEKGLEFMIRDELKTSMQTDKDKLSQVIRNLLSNAFKFTRQGSVSLAALPVPEQPEMMRFVVEDTGIGIPKEKQKVVFEAFQQADGSTSREFGGTGLGLTISREYIKLLKGTIELASEEEEGTTFTLTLPRQLPETADKEQAAPKEVVRLGERPKAPPLRIKATSASSAVEEIEDDRSSVTPADKVMLIIEDNADLAQNTMDVTRKMGFKVLVALNGRDGLALAATYRPTGILLDLVLPDINGMEVLRELKSTRELRHIPVHIMSSKERDNSFRKAGAVGYYQKPVNDIDIQHAIENLMSVSEKYPKQLLIVEDDETQREDIRKLIGDSDEIKITGVSSEDAAIEEIDKNIYDTAIIDLGLKNGSGYAICKYVKNNNIPLPLILYSGRALSEDEDRELRKYTDSIILKTAQSYERLSDEAAVFLHKMYHGESAETPPAAAPRPLETAGSLEGKKILIVDDDMKNIFVLASALENNGARVIDAQNGQIALDVLRENADIDLVLMDIMMPVMDGYAAMQEIRKEPTLKHLPIIALTAKALKGDRQKCIQAGADDYLSKPVDYDGLIRLAKAWIEKGK